MRWPEGRPTLGWYGDGRGERASVLAYGAELAFRAEGERRCVGVWRGGRRVPCPTAEVLAGRTTRAQCAECARLDRARSVAADTMADDPRPYSVYLAYFGPGLLKVGITGVARGSVRLLEQGAVAFTWLGRGPLMAARRAEELLRSALGVPDRIPYARKRAVRAVLPPVGVRAAELAGLHARAVALADWPEALERMPLEVVDHAEVFGLRPGEAVTAVVEELVEGGVVAGRLVAAAGPDLHLAVGGEDGGVVAVDSRLLSGWRLVGVGADAGTGAGAEGVLGTTVPVRPLVAPVVQDGLF